MSPAPAKQPTVVTPPAVDEPALLDPVSFTHIRAISDVPIVLAEIDEAATAIYAQISADAVHDLADDETDPKYQNLAAAVCTLANAVRALAKVNA